MSLSINTNPAALHALHNLNRTTSQLNETQLRIDTGLQVTSAKDNATIFAVAENLRADRKSLEMVKNSLDRAASVLDVTLAAAESGPDLLSQRKERGSRAAQAGEPDDGRAALQKDFESLRDQIITIVRNASFNGINMIDGWADGAERPATLAALISVDGAQKIEVPRQNLQLPQAANDLVPGHLIRLGQDSTFTSAAEAEALIDALNTSLENVSGALAVLGAGSTAMEQQRTFIEKLGDTMDTGIGSLVDANLARESARLQALQVKQQLGTQSLSIANQQPHAILSLFGN